MVRIKKERVCKFHFNEQQMSFPVLNVARSRWGLVTIGLGSVGSIVSAVVQAQRSVPCPEVYVRKTLKGVLDRDPPKDPKVEVRFANNARGQLHVRNLQVLHDGKAVTSFANLRKSPTYVMSSESSDLLGEQIRSYAKGSRITYATFRPTDEELYKESSKWDEDLCNDLQGVELEVTYSYFPFRFIKHTKKMPIFRN